MTSYKRPESVLIVIYSADGQVLMLRRSRPQDFWQSVTGSLEWGESALDAARRELTEETGLSPDKLKDCGQSHVYTIYPYFRHRYEPGVTTNREHVYRLEIDRSARIEIDPKEHLEFRWLPREAAAALATSHTNRDAILDWVPERATS